VSRKDFSTPPRAVAIFPEICTLWGSREGFVRFRHEGDVKEVTLRILRS
jgi:hypothetical protein